MENLVLTDIVASGDLFKLDLSQQRPEWSIQKVLFSSGNLIFFNQDGVLMSRIDISGCTIRRMTGKECGNIRCKYGFCFVTSRSIKRCILCALNEMDLLKWINIAEDHLYRQQDIIHRYIHSNEMVLGHGLVKRMSVISETATSSSSSSQHISMHLIVTNYPRVMMIDPNTEKMIEQIYIHDNIDGQPTIQLVDTLTFILKLGPSSLYKFYDDKGSAYWLNIFKEYSKKVPYDYIPFHPIIIGSVLLSTYPTIEHIIQAYTQLYKERIRAEYHTIVTPYSFHHLIPDYNGLMYFTTTCTSLSAKDGDSTELSTWFVNRSPINRYPMNRSPMNSKTSSRNASPLRSTLSSKIDLSHIDITTTTATITSIIDTSSVTVSSVMKETKNSMLEAAVNRLSDDNNSQITDIKSTSRNNNTSFTECMHQIELMNDCQEVVFFPTDDIDNITTAVTTANTIAIATVDDDLLVTPASTDTIPPPREFPISTTSIAVARSNSDIDLRDDLIHTITTTTDTDTDAAVVMNSTTTDFTTFQPTSKVMESPTKCTKYADNLYPNRSKYDIRNTDMIWIQNKLCHECTQDVKNQMIVGNKTVLTQLHTIATLYTQIIHSFETVSCTLGGGKTPLLKSIDTSYAPVTSRSPRYSELTSPRTPIQAIFSPPAPLYSKPTSQLESSSILHSPSPERVLHSSSQTMTLEHVHLIYTLSTLLQDIYILLTRYEYIHTYKLISHSTSHSYFDANIMIRHPQFTLNSWSTDDSAMNKRNNRLTIELPTNIPIHALIGTNNTPRIQTTDNLTLLRSIPPPNSKKISTDTDNSSKHTIENNVIQIIEIFRLLRNVSFEYALITMELQVILEKLQRYEKRMMTSTHEKRDGNKSRVTSTRNTTTNNSNTTSTTTINSMNNGSSSGDRNSTNRSSALSYIPSIYMKLSYMKQSLLRLCIQLNEIKTTLTTVPQ